MYQNKVLNHISTKLPKVLLCPWAENTSLTQKETMDRGAWIKIQKERHAGGLKKDKKVQKHKSAKWHGNEEQWIFLFTICYNPVVSELGATRRQR